MSPVFYCSVGYLMSMKRLTKAQVVSSEMKDLLLSKDYEDEERDRPHRERQRAHEEQLKRAE